MAYNRKEELRLFIFPKISYLLSKTIQLLEVLLIVFNGSNIHHFMLIRLDMWW